MRISPRALVAALVAVFPLALTQPALAHDALKSSDPAKNAEVETVEEVSLEFTARVRLPVVVVTGADGKRHESGKPSVDGPVVTQRLNGSLPKGKYTIAYRVVSSDGHPIQGEIPFTVTRGPQPSPSPTPEAASPSPESPSPEAAVAESTPAAPSAAAAEPVPAAEERQPAQAGIPGWVWIGAGLLVGVGIGVFFSLRSKKT